MDIHKVYKVFITPFRRKRMRHFENSFNIVNGVRVLDVGGTQFNWQFVEHHGSVVVVNLEKPKEWDDQLTDFTFEKGDGTKLPYESR